MFAFQLALNTNISIKNEVSGKWYESKWYNSNAFQECSLSSNKFALIRGLQIFINLKKHNSKETCRHYRFQIFYQRKKKVLRFRLILRDHLIISSKCLVTSARHHSRKSSICTIAEINHRKLQESKPTGGWYFFICIIKLLNHRKKAPQICPDLSICKNIGVSENKKK